MKIDRMRTAAAGENLFKSLIFFYILPEIFYVLGYNREPLRTLRRTRGGTSRVPSPTPCIRMSLIVSMLSPTPPQEM